MVSPTTPITDNSPLADSEEINVGEDSELSSLLNGHPLSEIAAHLGDYLGVGVDAISLMMFVSRAAGRLGIPINLAIYSDDPGAEHLIADRIINIVPETVKRTDSIKRFRDLAEQAFEDTELVLVRSRHNALFRFATEAASRDTARAYPPSVWLISDDQSTVPRLGPTLTLMARQTVRSLAGFGYHFSRSQESEETPALKKLRRLTLQLRNRQRYACPFQDRIRAAIKPSDALVFNRTLATIAALRIETGNIKGKFQSNSESVISTSDYRVARSLLNALPTPGELSQLSPYAAETGAELYEAFVENPNHQLSIPDNSAFGNKAFTRLLATTVTGYSYNTIKDHLERLEAERVVESIAVHEQQRNARVRRQGVQIYFRFNPAKVPPFGTGSPFAGLPTEEQIAEECNTSLQSERERGE